MGSISGLKSILLLVDLCTYRISDQNQNLKWFTLREFLVYKVQVYTRIMVLLPGIKQWSFGNCVKKTGVYVIWSRSTSFMVLLPGIN